MASCVNFDKVSVHVAHTALPSFHTFRPLFFPRWPWLAGQAYQVFTIYDGFALFVLVMAIITVATQMLPISLAFAPSSLPLIAMLTPLRPAYSK